MNVQKTKAYSENIEGKLLAIASEEIADRDGDILTIDGWDLKNFKKNPVLMWLHMMDGSTMPIGKANNIKIDNVGGKRKLVFEPIFHDLTPEAQTVKAMYEQGFLSAFSVGFQPKEWTVISESGEFPPRYKYLAQELLEISAVPIPALPSATIIERAEKAKMDVKSIKGILNQFKYAKNKDGGEDEAVEEDYKKEDEKPAENATPLVTDVESEEPSSSVEQEKEDTEEKSIAKRGRVLSAKNESKIKQAQSLLSDVLSALGQESEGEESDDKGFVTTEEFKKHIDRVTHLISEIQKDRSERKSAPAKSDEELVVEIVNKILEGALAKAFKMNSNITLENKGGEK